jgi:hydroxymethylpyrimidine/phosphomethylpyrimidine kinase
MRGRVLVIAGSDSGGGAGIQADIKTLTALGCYAATAITALTAQDTRAVYAVHRVPPDFLRLQIERALEDPGADAVKTGMLCDAADVALVADILAQQGGGLPVVVDPVMAASTGRTLLEPPAIDTMRQRLVPLASVLTPNVPEAELLTGTRIVDQAGMREAADALLALGAAAVLVKGRHRLHARERGCRGAGAGNGAASIRGAGTRLCAGSHCHGSRVWRRPRAAQPRGDARSRPNHLRSA